MPELQSQDLYVALVGFVALERLVEMWLSRRNAARVLARGGVEVGQGHYRVMVVLHTLFLLSCVFEVLWLARPFRPLIGTVSLAALALSMPLRYWAIATLGDRWNTRVLVEPGVEAVAGGPYRFVRHPNYVAVVLEIAALPLVHGAWLTAVTFTAANLCLLVVRIQVEERALREHCSYDRIFQNGLSN